MDNLRFILIPVPFSLLAGDEEKNEDWEACLNPPSRHVEKVKNVPYSLSFLPSLSLFPLSKQGPMVRWGERGKKKKREV